MVKYGGFNLLDLSIQVKALFIRSLVKNIFSDISFIPFKYLFLYYLNPEIIPDDLYQYMINNGTEKHF